MPDQVTYGLPKVLRPALAPAPGSPLSCWSTAALLDELKRRQEIAKPRSNIVPCDECKWFHATLHPQEDDNPCGKGHQMLFRCPDSESDRNWGFYRPGCRDRKRTDTPANSVISPKTNYENPNNP